MDSAAAARATAAVPGIPRDELPPMKAELAARIEAAFSGEERARFES